METGVERIVDQVVNPKINSVFLPTIEDISYKFLGIEKPKIIEQQPLPPLPATHSLPNEFGVSNGLTFDLGQHNNLPNDLEAVSPESDRCNASKSADSRSQSDEVDNVNTSIESGNTEGHNNDAADKSMCDDFESPAFEPLEGRASSAMSLVNDDDDEDGDNSKISAISGLTSQDSIESCIDHFVPEQPVYSINDLSRIPPPPPPLPPPPPPPEDLPPEPTSEPQLDTSDEQLHHDHNSALSQVSSNSRLSIVTSDSKSFSMPGEHCEEAQMPKFNENSSNSHNANAGNVALPASVYPFKERKPLLTSFDIKQDEIMFEGTRRHSICMDIKAEAAEQANNSLRPPSPMSVIPAPPEDSPDPPPPPADHPDSHEAKFESFCSTSLITSETKFLSLNDEHDGDCDVEDGIAEPPIDNSTVDMEFKFEEPAIDGASPKDRSRDQAMHKSRRRDRSSASSKSHQSSSGRDKDKDKDSSAAKQRHTSSSSSKDGSTSRNSSSHRREDKPNSKPSSSSSKHHSSSSHHRHHHHSSSSSSNKERSSSSKSSSSATHHKRSRSEKSSADDRNNRKSNEGNKANKKSDDKHEENGDDHYSQKQTTERRRSNDSNDGNNHPHPSSLMPPTSHPDSYTAPTQTISDNNSNESSSSTMNSTTCCDKATTSIPPMNIICPTESDEEFVAPQLPVVVDDQILNGCQEINLEMFIRQETSDPVLSSIQQTLTELDGSGSLLKKPKVASNIFEARKLIKVRKQMDRDVKKRLEQAMVLAKKYISSNSALASSLGMSDDQGVELEFACVTSSASPAPSISSPNKSVKQQQHQSKETLTTPSIGSDDEEFLGFDADSLSKERIHTFIKHTEHILTDCNVEHHSDYSRSIYLFDADAQVAKAFADLVVGDVWQYSKNDKRQQMVFPEDHLKTPTDIHSIIGSIPPIKTNRKRHSESSTSASDNNNDNISSSAAKTRKTTHIQYAATIQMTTVRSLDEDTFDDEEDDDDVRSMASDGYTTKNAPTDKVMAAVDETTIHISPTPSDHSFSSKENSFVPKIKKAVSRSIAHNTTMNANLACVVARKFFFSIRDYLTVSLPHNYQNTVTYL